MNRILLLVILFFTLKAAAQTCPPNIGFESGTFENWDCSSGTVDQGGGLHLTSSGPAFGRHTIYQKANNPGVDRYGSFPQLCPNGSNYSIQLGDDETPSIAQRITYTFVVPANQADYTIFYTYAAVLQDVVPEDSQHTTPQKPMFSAEIYDVATNQYITCASFSYNSGSSLPGFIPSNIPPPKPKPGGIVYYKNWTPASINLRGYGGRTIRLEFTTRCCTPGGHFGYAYIDVNEPCGTAITGNQFCTGEKSLKLYSPAGFYQYYWYNSDFSKLLGTSYTLNINPAPPDLTRYALRIVPYPGLGCPDTIYTTIHAVNSQFTFKIPDSIAICPGAGSVDITKASVTAGSSSNLTYTYYSDADGQNFLAYANAISRSGTYYIKALNSSGCSNILPIKVIISNPIFNPVDPAPVVYPARIDLSATYRVDTSFTYSYYKDALATVPLTNFNNLHYSGIYYIKATSSLGCYTIKAVTVRVNPPPPPTIAGPNTFTPNNDGVNDLFKITILGYGRFKNLQVFNRLGALVFSSTDINTAWDGNFKGKSVPTGTYYWVVNAENTYFRSAISQSGYIAVIR
jgi:gliding motility-associated-like protein